MNAVLFLVDSKNLTRLVFLLTALAKSIPTDVAIHIIPANAAWLADPQNLRDEIEEIKATTQATDPGEINIEIYLIGIGPASPLEAEQLIHFRDSYPNIVRWFSGGWTPEQVGYINMEMKVLTPLAGDTSIMDALKKAGYVVADHLYQNDRALQSWDTKAMAASPDIIDYCKAIKVAERMITLSDKDSLLFTVAAAVHHFRRGRVNDRFLQMLQAWTRIQEETTLLQKKITGGHPIFRTAAELGRPIGYAELGIVPAYIDIKEILYKALDFFPYMVVVRYTTENEKEEITEFGSDKFNVRHEMRNYKEERLVGADLLHLINLTVVMYEGQPCDCLSN